MGRHVRPGFIIGAYPELPVGLLILIFDAAEDLNHVGSSFQSLLEVELLVSEALLFPLILFKMFELFSVQEQNGPTLVFRRKPERIARIIF